MNFETEVRRFVEQKMDEEDVDKKVAIETLREIASDMEPEDGDRVVIIKHQGVNIDSWGVKSEEDIPYLREKVTVGDERYRVVSERKVNNAYIRDVELQ